MGTLEKMLSTIAMQQKATKTAMDAQQEVAEAAYNRFSEQQEQLTSMMTTLVGKMKRAGCISGDHGDTADTADSPEWWQHGETADTADPPWWWEQHKGNA